MTYHDPRSILNRILHTDPQALMVALFWHKSRLANPEDTGRATYGELPVSAQRAVELVNIAYEATVLVNDEPPPEHEHHMKCQVRVEDVWGADALRTNIEMMEADDWEFVEIVPNEQSFEMHSGYRCVIWRRYVRA